MKKTLIIPLLALGVGACIGCSNQEDLYKELQNFKLDNISDYQAIGIGSIEGSNSSKKSRKTLKREASKQDQDDEKPVYLGGLGGCGLLLKKYKQESSQPFTLIGQLKNGEMERLSFTNQRHSLNVPIWDYLNWGDYISFTVGNDIGIREDQSKVYALCNTGWFQSPDQHSTYTLSLSTGKIYESFATNPGFLTDYAKAQDGSTVFLFGADSGEAYRVYENEEGLNYKYLGKHQYERLDKYGNILVDNGIVSVTDSRLHKFESYLEGKVDISFDSINREIYAFSNEDGRTYFLNENGEFVEVSTCGMYADQNLNRTAERTNDNCRIIYENPNGVFYTAGPFARYKRYDSHSYYVDLPQDVSEKLAHTRNSIKRGNNLYALESNNHIYKYSLEEETLKELTINESFELKSMSIEDDEIVITGTDDSFNEFKGYLDQNDQISFEKTRSSDVVVLTPIN